MVKITRNMSSNFYLSFISIYGYIVSGFMIQLPGVSVLTPYMKLHLFRQDLQDYQNFFGLVWLYPVHPADPVR